MGQSSNPSRRLPPAAFVLLVAALLTALPIAASAADAHDAVKAKPGEMVLLRNVPTRVAYRSQPPAMALIVNPSPRSEISATLGTEELSDADYAGLNAASTHQTTVERVVAGSIDSSVGTIGGHTGAVSSNGISNVISGPMGAVGNTTRGIGNQIQGALAQLPGMMPATNGAGH